MTEVGVSIVLVIGVLVGAVIECWPSSPKPWHGALGGVPEDKMYKEKRKRD